MLRPRLLALALALAACTAPGATTDDAGDADPTADATAVPTTGEPDLCALAGDCPAPATCEQVACEERRCVVSPRAEGQRVDDVPGDCQALVCDGNGAGSPQPDDADLPVDGNDCTADLCDDGAPANPALPEGTACDGNQVCRADLSCAPCPERDACTADSPAEPNESQSQADARPTVLDDGVPVWQCEALGAPGDVDWFVFDAVDTALGVVAPQIDADPADIRVCIYFQCKAGGTNLECPDTTQPAAAPLGQQGCCGHGSFAPTIDCNGFDEDATIWLRVDHDTPDPANCVNYQVGVAY